jgi:hypothetical protein
MAKITGFKAPVEIQNNTSNSSANHNRAYIDYNMLVYTSFGGSLVAKLLIICDVFIRECVCLVLVLTFNLLVFLAMRQVSLKRTSMKGSTSRGDRKLEKAFKAEQQRARMILITGVLYLVGNLGYFLQAIKSVVWPVHSDAWLWAIIYLKFLFLVNNTLPFYYYFIFNKVFRATAIRTFKIMFYPV